MENTKLDSYIMITTRSLQTQDIVEMLSGAFIRDDFND
jgi:hypothetical protein